jgi:hypothetical protein
MAGIARRMATAALVAAAFLVTPARAQTPSPSQSLAQDLSSCAGAVAAQAGVDVLTYAPGGSNELSPLLDAILARLNVEPGVEGMTGRYAAADARRFWAEQPTRRRQTAVNRCRARFGEQ